MLTLPFTYNWNGKLLLDNFGTIRQTNKWQEGDFAIVTLKNTELGIVQIMAVREFKYKHITNLLSLLDCGKDENYLRKLLCSFYGQGKVLAPDYPLAHVVCQYTQRYLPAQQQVWQDWWNEKTNKLYA